MVARWWAKATNQRLQVRILVLTTKIKLMRSKVFQRILNDMDKDHWWVKLKRWFVVEYNVIKCLGFIKYFKNLK